MNKAEKELAQIKAMMERSTRFISLSGFSGVLAGIYALVGAGLAWYWISSLDTPGPGDSNDPSVGDTMNAILITAAVILIMAIGTAYLLSQKKSKKSAHRMWSPAGRRFLMALMVPVISGGLFSFALLHEGYFHFIPACTLVFYGLGLYGASHFTLGEIKNLGLGQLLLGFVAAFHPEYGLICWALGFGVLHVIYGSMMYYKYDR